MKKAAETAQHPNGLAIISRSDALASGLNRYFTGKACRCGHVCEQYTNGYHCVECNKEKPRGPGLKAKQKKYYENNAQKISARKRAHYARNKQSILLRNAEYVRTHKDRVQEYTAEWRKNNKEQFRAVIVRWNLEHPLAAGARSRNRRARKRAAEGNHTANEIAALLTAQRGKCAYCRASLRSGFHADHIMPLALGGSNWISNIQLTCATCNMTKNAKHPLDFARGLGMLV